MTNHKILTFGLVAGLVTFAGTRLFAQERRTSGFQAHARMTSGTTVRSADRNSLEDKLAVLERDISAFGFMEDKLPETLRNCLRPSYEKYGQAYLEKKTLEARCSSGHPAVVAATQRMNDAASAFYMVVGLYRKNLSPADEGMEKRPVRKMQEPQRPMLEWKATLRDARSRSQIFAGTRGGSEYGDALTENRVMGALRWLKAQQGSDGSWGEKLAPQLTALAVLMYLGHGETPMCDKNSADEFSATVENGLNFLVDYVQSYEESRQSGRFVDDISYLHAVQALCDAYGMTANEKYGMVANKGLHHIMTKLRPDGGYAGATDGIPPCLILTTYSIQTLSMGLMVGLQPTGAKDCMARSLKFLREVDYQALPESVRGDLVLFVKAVFAFIGVRTSDGIERVAEQYDNITPALGQLINRSSFLTSALYCSAMRKGASSVAKNKWKAWNAEMKKRYIAECITDKVLEADGSERSVCYWDHFFDGHSKIRDHVIMTTCLVTSQFTIYYRTPIDFSIAGIVGEDI